MDEATEQLSECVRRAARDRRSLCIRAGGTKDFYGNLPRGELLDPRAFAGLVSYDPAELVVTVRAGTPLADVEDLLEARGQMLAFEPPHFGRGATVGGCIAAGIAGPRSASAGAGHGAIRDFVLGAKLLDGRGRLLKFGGTVIKNVAGYDVSRALAGSLGFLGVIVELSLKVVPRPPCEITLIFELDEQAALECMNSWCGEPLPISASAWCRGSLALRLSGAPAALAAACSRLGGEELEAQSAARLWTELREHNAEYFLECDPLWRLSLPSTAPAVGLSGPQLIEWGGALRWLGSDRPQQELHQRAMALGGYATQFRGGDRTQGVFAPLSPALFRIHAGLKAEFDPAGIFNPGRLVPGL